jgi:hypothetical protein
LSAASSRSRPRSISASVAVNGRAIRITRRTRRCARCWRLVRDASPVRDRIRKRARRVVLVPIERSEFDSEQQTPPAYVANAGILLLQ